MEQTCMNFEVAEVSVKTVNDMVQVILGKGGWFTPWEICDEIYRTRGLRISDSSCTARLRDARKPQYGGHTIAIRKRAGSKAFEYKLEK